MMAGDDDAVDDDSRICSCMSPTQLPPLDDVTSNQTKYSQPGQAKDGPNVPDLEEPMAGQSPKQQTNLKILYLVLALVTVLVLCVLVKAARLYRDSSQCCRDGCGMNGTKWLQNLLKILQTICLVCLNHHP